LRFGELSSDIHGSLSKKCRFLGFRQYLLPSLGSLGQALYKREMIRRFQEDLENSITE
jgi:hypothetical protein